MSLSPLSPSEAGASQQGYKYNRKQKSLGLLCSNFVSLYNRDNVESISLDEAARRLAVERRRIYDIVNILETVGVLSRKAKNAYFWIGFSGMPKALCRLRVWLVEIFHLNMQSCLFEDSDYDVDENPDQYIDDGDEKLSRSKKTISGMVLLSTSTRKEKSLGMLTENFIKLFMTTDKDTISLDEAASLLLGANNDASYMRTKVRRLYDIANVLSSIDLIEKTQLDTRKPAFRWLGTTDKMKKNNTVTVESQPTPKKSNKRIFGAEITNTDLKNRMASTVDKKPKIVRVTSENLKERNIIPHKQLGSKSEHAFGPFHPVMLSKQGAEGEVKCTKGVQECETLASAFRPLYRNQALGELFAHYKEAWKKWYEEATRNCS
ncbi:hypothetical protein Cni_G29042 [Canna indica]|uniref:E2F/DP family winged-helix DNA-binding domain-containing protein n=1 Tax=Canna indica TaxID=4628 RepID=A0AAQ3L3X8_9LILI|nr:hypothetical protein Cni_G29042 [Canna indica]